MLMKSKLFKSVACGLAVVSFVSLGCGEKKVVDKAKEVAANKMETAVNILDQAKSNPKYAQFRALKLNCSYETACKVMLGKPSFSTGHTCMWASNGDSIICDFEDDKLFSKIFDTKKIILKDPFSREQYNMILQGDSYDTVKEKLNKQDGYLSAHFIMPPFGEFEQYSWRNPDGMVAEIRFMDGKVANGSLKNSNNVKAGANGASNSSLPQGKSAATSNDNSTVQPFNSSAIYSTTQSSFDNEEGYHHDAAKAVDGDIKSCWAEGVKGLGIGEYIQINFNGVYKVSGLNIWPGHQKSQDLFYKNARPVAIRIIGSDGSNEVYGLNDSMGMQRVNFRYPINVNNIKIVVDKVARGNKYEDTCIGEVSFF